MKKFSFFLVLLAAMTFALPAKGAERLTSPDGKKVAYVKNGEIIVRIDKTETVLRKKRTKSDYVNFLKWSPKSDVLVYEVIEVYPEESGVRADDCDSQVCASKAIIYFYKTASNRNTQIIKTVQYLGSSSFGGVVAFPYKGSKERKELCINIGKGCTEPIIFGDGNISFAINIMYFKNDDEFEKFITEIPSESGSIEYLYHSMVVTVDYDGKLLKQGPMFYIHDPSCCELGD